MACQRFLVLCVVVSLLIHQCYTAVSIAECSSDGRGKFTFDERTSTSLTLTCIGITKAENVWEITLQSASGTSPPLQLAHCTVRSCVSLNPVISVNRNALGVSSLSVNGNFRNTISGTITCMESGAGEQVQSSAACAVRVVYSATEHESRFIESSNADWTLRGSFTVVKVFASDEEYSCDWTLIGDVGTQDRSIKGTVDKTPFNDGGLVFFSATCGLLTPVATVKGSYIGYRTQFSPAGVQEISTKTSFAVGPPTAPPQLINCPTRAPNSSTVSCTCRAAPATPPAVVTWSSNTSKRNSSQRNSEAVLELLPIDQGKKNTCLQNWGGPGGYNWATTYTYVYSGDDDDDDDDSVAGVYAGAAGGVLGCIAVVAGVIVIVVVWKRRIAAEETKGGAMETLASHDERDDNPDQFDTEDMHELNDYEVPLLATANQGVSSAAIDMSQYSALDTRDIGQRSEYAEFSPYQNTGINRGRAGKTTRSEYSSLQRQEIGLKSEYSEFSPYENSPSRIRRK